MQRTQHAARGNRAKGLVRILQKEEKGRGERYKKVREVHRKEMREPEEKADNTRAVVISMEQKDCTIAPIFVMSTTESTNNYRGLQQT